MLAQGHTGPGAPVYGGALGQPPTSAAGTRSVGEIACSPVWDDGGMGARVSDRIAAIAESATLAVDAKAKALKAAGRPVIGFGAGEPDFPTPDYIVEAAVAAARDPQNHRYTPVAGLPELRAAIAAKTRATAATRSKPPRY